MNCAVLHVLGDLVAVDIELTLLIWRGNDDVTKSHMVVEVSVVGDTATDANQENVFDVTECTYNTTGIEQLDQVLRCNFNISRDSILFAWQGRPFQMVGTATEKKQMTCVISDGCAVVHHSTDVRLSAIPCFPRSI